MKSDQLALQILIRAGFKIGGGELARRLGVADAQLTKWLSGEAVPPADIVLKALDVLEPANSPHNGSEAASSK